MAKITPPESGNFGRLPFSRNRNVSFKTWKGQPYIAKRQGKRGSKMSRRQEAWVDHFSWSACLSKQPDAFAYDFAKTMSDLHNETSTMPNNRDKWYIRDFLERGFNGQLMLEEGETPITTPTAKVFRDAPEPITANEFEILTPNDLYWDNNAFWNSESFPHRLTARAAGLYIIGWETEWSPSADGVRYHRLIKNDAIQIMTRDYRSPANGYFGEMGGLTIEYLHIDDYIHFEVHTATSGQSCQLVNLWMCGITPEGIVLP